MKRLLRWVLVLVCLAGPGWSSGGTPATEQVTLSCGQTLTLALADAPLKIRLPVEHHWLEQVAITELGIDLVVTVTRGHQRRTRDGFPSKLTRESWVAFGRRETLLEVRPKFLRQRPGQVQLERQCGLAIQPLADWLRAVLLARAQQALADLEYDRADALAAALADWRHAASWLQAAGSQNRAELAWLEQARAYAHLYAGEHTSALPLLSSASQHWQAAGRLREAAVSGYSLAVLQMREGQPGNAKLTLDAAAKLADAGGDRYWHTMIRQQECLRLRQSVAEHAAAQCNQQVLSAYVDISDFQAAAGVAHNLAVLQRLAGQREEARRLAARARDWSDPASRNHVRALAVLGRLDIDRGLVASAVGLLSEAAEIAQRQGYLEEQVQADLDLVGLYLGLDELWRAQRILDLVRPQLPRLGWRTQAWLRLLDAQVATRAGDSGAATTLNAVADLYAEKNRPDHAAAARLSAAQAAWSERDAEAARRTLAILDPRALGQRQAEALAQLELELQMADTRASSARLAQLADGPGPRDVRLAMRRDQLLARWSLAARTPTDRQRALALADRWLTRLARGIRSSASPAVQSALRRQAEPFLALFAEVHFADAGQIDPQAIATVWLAREDLRRTPVLRQQSRAGFDAAVLDPAARWIARGLLGDSDWPEATATDEEELLRALDARQQDGAVSPMPTPSALIQALTEHPHGTVLELVAGEQRSWLLRADANGLSVVELPGQSELDGRIGRVRAWAEGLRPDCPDCVPLAHDLGLAGWSGDRLTVLGGGPMARLPWAALPLPHDGAPLSARAAILHADRLWRESPAATETASGHRQLIVIAATRGGRWQTEGRALPALPGARAEVQSLVANLGHTVRLNLDAEATPTAFRDALDTPGSDVLLAAHGFADARRWHRAGLLLDSPGGAVALTLPELLDWPIRVHRVVLSACTTVPELAAIDDPAQSLGAALLAGGAQEVVGSQWEISDRAAVLLTRAFHADPALDSAEALRHAQSQLRRTRAFRAPRYWSGLRVLRRAVLPGIPDAANPLQVSTTIAN